MPDGQVAITVNLPDPERIAPLLSGRIDAEKLQALLGTAIHADDVDEWFLCGPFEMVSSLRKLLVAEGTAGVKVNTPIAVLLGLTFAVGVAGAFLVAGAGFTGARTNVLTSTIPGRAAAARSRSTASGTRSTRGTS